VPFYHQTLRSCRTPMCDEMYEIAQDGKVLGDLSPEVVEFCRSNGGFSEVSEPVKAPEALTASGVSAAPPNVAEEAKSAEKKKPAAKKKTAAKKKPTAKKAK